VDKGYMIHPSHALQGDLVVDPAHDVVDLEASQSDVFNDAQPFVASLLDAIKAEAHMWA
jgi:hypothetical protein